MATRRGKYEFWRSEKDRQWYWHLRSSNGRIVAQGEGYKRRGGVLKGIAVHIRTASTARIVELKGE